MILMGYLETGVRVVSSHCSFAAHMHVRAHARAALTTTCAVGASEAAMLQVLQTRKEVGGPRAMTVVHIM